MTPMFTLAEALALIPGGALKGDPSIALSRVHTDTRTLQPGDLFLALKGERFDANDFLTDARAKGAAAAIAQRGRLPAGFAGIEVDDTKAALGALAAGWRARFTLPVIAVTGSNGKTTVTQMVASILRAWHGDAMLATRGNLNNDIGLPLTVLRLRAGHRAAVLELGMNHPGEIAYLAQIAKPTVALVNNAQREHQEFMATVEAVARENGAVLQALGSNGTAVFPADDEFTPLWMQLAGGRGSMIFGSAVTGVGADSTAAGPPQGGRAPSGGSAVHAVTSVGADSTAAGPPQGGRAPSGGSAVHAVTSVGAVPHADIFLAGSEWQEGRWQVGVQTPAGRVDYPLHIAGRHNVRNSLAAIACALAAGAPLSAIAHGLESFEPVKGRSRAFGVTFAGRTLTVVDDTYNANPDSARAAVEVLAELPGPRLLVLGDMGEVGDQGPQFHAEAGDHARTRGIDLLFTLGDQSKAMRGRHFEDIESLKAAVLAELPRVQSILVKGSRFMKMERVVEAITACADREEKPHAA